MATPKVSYEELDFEVVFSRSARVQYNQALRVSDVFNNLAVEGTLSTPPSSPSPGEAWIVGAAPTGDWSGASEDWIAAWLPGSPEEDPEWYFVVPFKGLELWDASVPDELVWDGTDYVTTHGVPGAGGNAQIVTFWYQALGATAETELVEFLEMAQEADGTQWTVGGTAANAVDAVDSDDDAKYMFETTDNENHRYWNADPVALNDTHTILQVDLEVRAWRASGSSDNIEFGFRIPTVTITQAQALTGTPTTYLKEDYSRPGGGSWTFSDFDDQVTNQLVRTLIRHDGASGDEIRVSRMRIKITYE